MSTTGWVIGFVIVSLVGTVLACLYWRKRARDEEARAELLRKVEAARTPRPYPWQRYERAQSFERMPTINPKRGEGSHEVVVPPSSRPLPMPVKRAGSDDEYDAELARRQQMHRVDDTSPLFELGVAAALALQDMGTTDSSSPSNDNAGSSCDSGSSSSDSSSSSDYSGGGGDFGGGGASGDF